MLKTESDFSKKDVQQALKKYIFLSVPSDTQTWVTYQAVPAQCRGLD